MRLLPNGLLQAILTRNTAEVAAVSPEVAKAQIALFSGLVDKEVTDSLGRTAIRHVKPKPAQCQSCKASIPRHDEHAAAGRCGACVRTVDWLDRGAKKLPGIFG